MPFLGLIRYQNLLMIIATQYLVKYFLFKPFGISVSLDDFQFFLLVLAVVLIAAAGNIINDIHDTTTDAINKPDKQIIGTRISEKTGTNWFILLNILGVGIGFYLANLVGQPSFSALFILPSAFLYLYATYLKGKALLGNIIISLLVGLSILIVGIFELLPAITPENRVTQRVLFSILIDYAVFAFLINLLREMVKDQEDLKGDYNAGMHTLPVVLGRERTNKLIFFVGLLPLAALLYYIYTYLFENMAAVLYVLFLILAPLLFYQVKILRAKKRKDFHHLSVLLKFILLAGVLSIGLYQFII